eukprot:Amastigsp_a4412_375.p3 type:complete len:214 gc:universal Amastigsp_a4412_375:267-908(+)
MALATVSANWACEKGRPPRRRRRFAHFAGATRILAIASPSSPAEAEEMSPSGRAGAKTDDMPLTEPAWPRRLSRKNGRRTIVNALPEARIASSSGRNWRPKMVSVRSAVNTETTTTCETPAAYAACAAASARSPRFSAPGVFTNATDAPAKRPAIDAASLMSALTRVTPGSASSAALGEAGSRMPARTVAPSLDRCLMTFEPMEPDEPITAIT